MYGHLLPTIEVSRPASRASVKQDISQFQQESQSPEVVNESTILSPTDQSAPVFYQPTPDNSVAHEAIPENVEPQDLTPYKFRWDIFDRDSKGQLNSEWIYEVIVSSKMPTKNLKDYCPTL